MDARRIRQVAAVLSGCGLGLLTGCFPIVSPETADFSDFETFAFSGDAICGPGENVAAASIQRIEGERYELELSVLECGVAGVDDCDPQYAETGCFVVRDLPERELTAVEAEQMRAIFAAVTVERVRWFPFCVFPCEIRWAEWDDVRLTDFKTCTKLAGFRTLSYKQMDEIAAFLETLADAD